MAQSEPVLSTEEDTDSATELSRSSQSLLKSAKKDEKMAAKAKTEDADKEEKEWIARIKRFGEQSSFSSLVYEFKDRSLVTRIFWTFVLLAAISAFLTVTVIGFKRLATEPIATSITVSRQQSMEFPAVTICSLSFLNTTKLEEKAAGWTKNNDTQTFFNAMLEMFDLGRVVSSDRDACNEAAEEALSNITYEYGISKLIAIDAANDPFELIHTCNFLGEDCTKDNSMDIIQTLNGVCLIFNGPNSGPARRVSGTGPRQGLRLEIFMGDQFFSFGRNYGFSVIVHNRDEPPRPESEGVVVGYNDVLYINMREVVSEDQTNFYSGMDCTRRTDYVPDFLYFGHPVGYNYSPSLCMLDCFYRFIADECNCKEGNFYIVGGAPDSYADMPNCTLNDFCCETHAIETFDASCDCPPKCETVERTLTVSSATHETVDQGYIGINVFYGTLMREERVTTDAYSPWSLISDVGGNTGLFLGFNILTIAEVIILLAGLITDWGCLSWKKRTRKYLHVKHLKHAEP